MRTGKTRRDGGAGKIGVSVRSDNHSRDTISAIFGRRDSMSFSVSVSAHGNCSPGPKEPPSSCAVRVKIRKKFVLNLGITVRQKMYRCTIEHKNYLVVLYSEDCAFRPGLSRFRAQTSKHAHACGRGKGLCRCAARACLLGRRHTVPVLYGSAPAKLPCAPYAHEQGRGYDGFQGLSLLG